MDKQKNVISQGLFYLITMFIPLYFEDAYFNMSQAKGHIYMVGSCILLVMAGMIMILEKMKYKKSDCKCKRQGLLFFEKTLILLAILSLLSSLCSASFPSSLLGTTGWSIGAYTIVSWILIYFLLTRWGKVEEKDWAPSLMMYGVIFVIGIGHSMGIDLLYLHRGIFEPQWYDYLTTIGHKNWYVGFLCLLIPMLSLLFIREEGKRQIFYGIILELAIWNMILCDSDGIYLGLLLCMVFALLYIGQNQKYIRKAFLVLTGYGLALLLISVSGLFQEKVLVMEGISKTLLSPPVGLVILALSILAWFLLGKVKLPDKIRVGLSRGLSVLCLLIFAGYWIHTYMNFDASWGTNRGEIWTASMEIFRGFSLKQKLIGVGPEMLKEWYAPLSETRSLVVLVSHSEPIQILLTMGILGLIAWIATWGFLILFVIKRKLYVEDTAVYLLPMIAYLGQSFVNSAMTTNLILFCVMAVFLRRKMEENESVLQIK